MQNGRQKCCQLMRVMADHTKVIAILVIPWVAAFNAVSYTHLDVYKRQTGSIPS